MICGDSIEIGILFWAFSRTIVCGVTCARPSQVFQDNSFPTEIVLCLNKVLQTGVSHYHTHMIGTIIPVLFYGITIIQMSILFMALLFVYAS